MSPLFSLHVIEGSEEVVVLSQWPVNCQIAVDRATSKFITVDADKVTFTAYNGRAVYSRRGASDHRAGQRENLLLMECTWRRYSIRTGLDRSAPISNVVHQFDDCD